MTTLFSFSHFNKSNTVSILKRYTVLCETSKMFLILCCFFLLLGLSTLSYEHHINTVNDLIEFSNNVSSGTNYKGTTVFLDVDMDFSGGLSEQFEPIGNSDDNKLFQGTFDGQGHTISNLAINSYSLHVGLFGYSEDATIRNVVLDSSFSVVSSYSGSNNVHVGGIIGKCSGCTIENTVNMESVSFTGSTSSGLLIGGIVGRLYSSSKDATVRNCANYGSVTHSGTAYYANIGGIIGESSGSSTKYIQNCLNYGTINHSGATSSNLRIGGILGYACFWNKQH